ncbi:MAG: ABC transporter ATP-binding protein [Cyanobacteria bacterium NC_groundwater_1444_Ag_S-0.65um_54_12]|nr:ABC transporter ATP-binding protein [Cyanobacteria bacterium NC_groundwater_1444_Ag_S-0.65um_54_12]
MLLIHDLVKHYRMGEQIITAIAGVSLTIQEGEFFAIMGASGSGKSTLLNIIGCLDRPTAGKVELDGRDLSQCDDATLARVRNQKIGFVFQQFNLLPRFSALENVELPLIYAGSKPQQRKLQALAVLERVGLSERTHHKPSELSGGQQQRVAIARAIVNRPRLLLADEPTGALDSRTSTEIMDLFTELGAQGMAIVMVTHDPEVATYAHKIIRLRDGRILSGTPARQ